MKKFINILLCINIFFLQSYLIRFQIFNYPTNLQEILILINAAAFIFVTPFKELWYAVKRHWLILSLVGMTLFSIVFVPIQNELDFLRHLKFLFFASILAFVFLETFKTEKERKNGLKIMGFGALAFGIFSVFYNLLGFNVAHDLRLLGPLDAAVYLGYYLPPFFIFFAIGIAKNPQEKNNWIYATLLALLIIATRSMGAIGGSIFILLAYFSKTHFNKKTLILGTIVMLVAGTVIFYSKILPTLQTNYSSLDERGEIWITSAELLKDPRNLFLGVGFGQFEHHYIENVDNVLGRPPLDYKIIQPHNIFLLFTFHYGILGLALIFFIIFKTIQNFFKPSENEIQYIANFILLYFLLHGLIDTPIFKNDLLFLFILFVELAVLNTSRKLNHAKQPRDPLPW